MTPSAMFRVGALLALMMASAQAAQMTIGSEGGLKEQQDVDRRVMRRERKQAEQPLSSSTVGAVTQAVAELERENAELRARLQAPLQRGEALVGDDDDDDGADPPCNFGDATTLWTPISELTSSDVPANSFWQKEKSGNAMAQWCQWLDPVWDDCTGDVAAKHSCAVGKMAAMGATEKATFSNLCDRVFAWQKCSKMGDYTTKYYKCEFNETPLLKYQSDGTTLKAFKFCRATQDGFCPDGKTPKDFSHPDQTGFSDPCPAKSASSDPRWR